jgi:1A family penicillin-binding protein
MASRHVLWRRALVVVFLALAGLGFFILGGVLFVVAVTPMPDADSFAFRQIDQSTKIYDRTGQILLYDYNRDAKREVVTIADISPNIVNAVIAIEDSSFYKHGGIRLTSIFRAILADVGGGSFSQGGSTITQQVVKNTLLTSRKSIIRKLHEWVLAIKLEQVYTKDQILETYLNNMPYGGTLYGVEAAAETYFGKTAENITVAEAAYLAAMIQAPSYYSPYGTHKEELIARKNVVLERMYALGFLDNESYATAKSEDVTFATGSQNAIIAPHFVFYIINQLEEKYGSRVLLSGLKVITTLDADLETKVESLITQYAVENERNLGVANTSLVAVDPSTGQILAMVGSRNFFDKEIDGQFNAALALRQPGSAMKPFIYSLALLNGYTRNTVVFDVPTQFSSRCDVWDVMNSTPPCYAPKNYDNNYRGPLTFQTALAQSVNIPAVKVLYLVGIQNAVSLARLFGLGTLGDPNQYGLALVLGGGEVRLLDLTGAYAVFANEGIKNTQTGILEVADSKGNVLEEYKAQQTVVIPANIARDISAILSDAPSRYPLYSLNSPLSIPGYDVAVKTGTTDDTRDVWAVGYTPSVALGVWIGNNDNQPLAKSASGLITPLWHDAMMYAVSKYPKAYFGEPSPIYSSVPLVLQGNWYIPDSNGNIVPHSLLYWTDKNNPQGPPPTNPSQDPQFAHWEYGVSLWYASRPELFTGGVMLPVPLTYEQSTTTTTN